MKNHPKLFALLFIIITAVFFITGVTLIIKSKLIIGCISWLVSMIFLINAINCIWDSKKEKQHK